MPKNLKLLCPTVTTNYRHNAAGWFLVGKNSRKKVLAYLLGQYRLAQETGEVEKTIEHMRSAGFEHSDVENLLDVVQRYKGAEQGGRAEVLEDYRRIVGSLQARYGRPDFDAGLIRGKNRKVAAGAGALLVLTTLVLPAAHHFDRNDNPAIKNIMWDNKSSALSADAHADQGRTTWERLTFSDDEIVEGVGYRVMDGHGTVIKNWALMNALDGSFDEKKEAVNSLLDTAGLEEGRYILHIKAVNSEGDETSVIWPREGLIEITKPAATVPPEPPESVVEIEFPGMELVGLLQVGPKEQNFIPLDRRVRSKDLGNEVVMDAITSGESYHNLTIGNTDIEVVFSGEKDGVLERENGCAKFMLVPGDGVFDGIDADIGSCLLEDSELFDDLRLSGDAPTVYYIDENMEGSVAEFTTKGGGTYYAHFLKPGSVDLDGDNKHNEVQDVKMLAKALERLGGQEAYIVLGDSTDESKIKGIVKGVVEFTGEEVKVGDYHYKQLRLTHPALMNFESKDGRFIIKESGPSSDGKFAFEICQVYYGDEGGVASTPSGPSEPPDPFADETGDTDTGGGRPVDGGADIEG